MPIRVALTAIVTLIAVLTLSATAGACTTEARSAAEMVRSADVAVYGRVVSVRLIEGKTRWHARFEAKVRVVRVFKGRPGPALRIRGYVDGAICGFGKVWVGKPVGLLLKRPSGPYTVTIDSRISLADLKRGTRRTGH